VKLLALQPKRTLHREQIVDLLWPSTLRASGLGNIRQHLFVLRSTLMRRGLQADLVVSCGERLCLASQVRLDIHDFACAARRASIDPRYAEKALDLYAGDLLVDDLYEPWTEPHREWLQVTYDRLLPSAAAAHFFIRSARPGCRAVP
jgi:DNA-binding SARP family transcriptional activator